VASKILSPISAENSPNINRKLQNIAVTGSIDFTPPSSPVAKQFLKNFSDSMLLLLIDNQKKKGKKLEDIFREIP